MRKLDAWELGLIGFTLAAVFVTGEGVKLGVDSQVNYVRGAKAYNIQPDQEFNTWAVGTGLGMVVFGRETDEFNQTWKDAEGAGLQMGGLTEGFGFRVGNEWVKFGRGHLVAQKGLKDPTHDRSEAIAGIVISIDPFGPER